MYRQSPSRSHRSKGIKAKHILQICLFLAVCFWLIYQVKHSHDKKKEYGQIDDKVIRQSPIGSELMKLGRKDIRPREDATISEKANNDEKEEEEEEETNEEKYEGNKGEDVPEFKEQKEDDETDDHDEHEEEKLDVDVDREAELVDGQEKEDSAGNGAQETDSELTHGQMDKKNSSEETDHDGDDRSVDEAREEHYKADDASSAVTHDVQTRASGNENEQVENSNSDPGSILREGNKESEGVTSEGENRKYLEVEGDQTTGGNQQLNATTNETKVDVMNTTENSSSSNIMVTEVDNNLVATNSSTEVTLENRGVLSQNYTEIEPKLEPGQKSPTIATSSEESNLQIITKNGANNTTVDVNGSHFDSNSTAFKEPQIEESHIENFANSSANNNNEHMEAAVLENTETSIEAGNNTDSVSENNNEGEALKSDTSDVTDETLESTVTENPDDISDTSNALEANVSVDLETLPEIQTEGSNSEEVAAE